jgi:hypothetical protein
MTAKESRIKTEEPEPYIAGDPNNIMNIAHASCPKCGHVFSLSDALKHDIREQTRKELSEEIKKKDAEYQKQLRDMHANYIHATDALRAKLMVDALKKARDEQAVEFKDLETRLLEKARIAEEAQRKELELRKEKRAAEERMKTAELDLQRRLDEQLAAARAEIAKDADERNRLKLAEKEKQMHDMRVQLEAAQRTADLASQQAQGEVLELDIEAKLKERFPDDVIEPVKTGVKGADISQTVRTREGREVGTVLWEIKRTKAWSEPWVKKIHENMVDAKADVGVIVSEAMPKDAKQFVSRDSNIWVSDISSAVGLGLVLRNMLLQIARERRLEAQRTDRKDLIYHYVTGEEFKKRVEYIARTFMTLQENLTTQRRTMEKYWSVQEKTIEQITKNFTGIDGDLTALSGMRLPALAVDAEVIP